MSRITKYIRGYYKFYSVTEDGKIYSHRQNKFMARQKDKKGYYCIGLYDINKKYKRYRIHRLVALHFLDNLLNKPCVNHINGDKLDNRVDNLEWCTISENNRHSYKIGLSSRKGELHNRSKLTDKDALYIYNTNSKTNLELSKKFKVDKSIISKIKNKKIWKHIHIKN